MAASECRDFAGRRELVGVGASIDKRIRRSERFCSVASVIHGEFIKNE
jgi:hypothetical protein